MVLHRTLELSDNYITYIYIYIYLRDTYNGADLR